MAAAFWGVDATTSRVTRPIGGTVRNGSEKISAAIPTELRVELERQARANDRSMSAEVRLALREHVTSPASSARPTRHALVADQGPDHTGLDRALAAGDKGEA